MEAELTHARLAILRRDPLVRIRVRDRVRVRVVRVCVCVCGGAYQVPQVFFRECEQRGEIVSVGDEGYRVR